MPDPLSRSGSHLDAFYEVHAACRQWAGHLPPTLPYVDLMFGFGFATLGDRTRAAAIVEDARRLMEVPIPERWAEHAVFEMVVSAVVSTFLFRAFKYRIEQALEGKPHLGSLSAELESELEEIKRRSGGGGTNNPCLRADYVIGRMREDSRIVEPEERVDVYDYWSKNQTQLKAALAELSRVRDPNQLRERIRSLLRDGVGGEATYESQLLVLLEALPHSPRAGELFAVELLGLVPEVLRGGLIDLRHEPPDLPKKRAELLERALFLANHVNHGDHVKQLMEVFCEMVSRAPRESCLLESQLRLVSIVCRQCLRSLKKMGMRVEIERLLATLSSDFFDRKSPTELREMHGANPERWGLALQSILHLASGWSMVELSERAASILEMARHELLSQDAVKLNPRDYTEVSRAYVTALGEGPVEMGLSRITELFQKMPRYKITNTWTTANYFSRFHLCLVEDVIWAICRMGAEPHIVMG